MLRLARTPDYHLPGLPDFGSPDFELGATLSDSRIQGALWGTQGDDVFVVSDPNTRIIDWVGQGIDTVLLQTNRLNLEAFSTGSSFNQASGAIENVVGNVDGVAFEITGNRFNNYLSGGYLGDTISGGYGTDVLIRSPCRANPVL
jgi:Ca2+-binding RTX toxin-like protein